MRANHFVLVLLSLLSMDAVADDCQRSTLLKDFNNNPAVVVGIGQSNLKNNVDARIEAKNRAYQDITTQLLADVDTSMNLKESDSATTFSADTFVRSYLEDLKGIKLLKEAKVKKTTCMAYVFDLEPAFNESKGEMRVLESKLKDAITANKMNRYTDLIRLHSTAKKDILDNKNNIIKADAFKSYLKKDGMSYSEKFNSIASNLDNGLSEAKEKIVFFIPKNDKYENMLLDAQNMISSKGYRVVIGGEKPKNGFELSFKENGKERKTNTALGMTIFYNVSLILKDITSNRTLGANRTATVQGFSKDGNVDDALAVATRQMSLNVAQLLNEALPGFILED